LFIAFGHAELPRDQTPAELWGKGVVAPAPVDAEGGRRHSSSVATRLITRFVTRLFETVRFRRFWCIHLSLIDFWVYLFHSVTRKGVAPALVDAAGGRRHSSLQILVTRLVETARFPTILVYSSPNNEPCGCIYLIWSREKEEGGRTSTRRRGGRAQTLLERGPRLKRLSWSRGWSKRRIFRRFRCIYLSIMGVFILFGHADGVAPAPVDAEGGRRHSSSAAHDSSASPLFGSAAARDGTGSGHCATCVRRLGLRIRVGLRHSTGIPRS
jgi:hypothetical protein